MFVDKLFIETVIEENPTETIKGELKKVESIGDYVFGHGYEKVIAKWEGRFFAALNALHKRGLDVILIAHSREKTARNQGGDEYKKHGIDMSHLFLSTI